MNKYIFRFTSDFIIKKFSILQGLDISQVGMSKTILLTTTTNLVTKLNERFL